VKYNRGEKMIDISSWGAGGMIGAIILLIIWIATLVYQGKRKEWIWFILSLLFGIVVLIYWIVYWDALKKILKKMFK
jgi:hypothetical protein